MQVLALDSETELPRPGVKFPRLVCVSASFDGVQAELLHHTQATRFLVEALKAAAAREVRIVGHNLAGYDLPVFAAHEPRLLPLIFAALDADGIQDTLLNEKLVDLALGQLRFHEQQDDDGDVSTVNVGYSLEEIARRRFGLQLDKGEDGWRLRYGELRDLPIDQWPERARLYALDDALIAWRLYKDQWIQGRALFRDLFRPAPGEARALFSLSLMAGWGVHSDPDRLGRFETREQTKLEDARRRMEGAGLIRIGGTKKAPKWVRNTKAIKGKVIDAFTASGELLPITKKGLELEKDLGRALEPVEREQYVSTAAMVLKMSRDPDLSTCVDYARAQKNLSTYVPFLRRGIEHPIQPGVDSIKENGRTSTFDPNLQNLPRQPGVRECLVPRAGHVFCSVDYDTAELRAWAQVCLWTVGFSRLAELYQRDPNADPHTGLAADILGITEAEAFTRKKAKDPEIKAARQRAKAGNFGLPGGMGAERFAVGERKKFWETDGHEGVDMSDDEAEDVKKAWASRWVEAGPYFDWVERQLGADRSGIFRCFASGRYRGGVGFCDGANTSFSSLIAWGAKMAHYAVTRACYVEPSSPLYGSRPVIFAHDEIVCEHRIERAAEAAVEQARIQITVLQSFMPDVPVTASPALMLYLAKDAEPVYRDGRLVIWQGEDPLAPELPPAANDAPPVKLCPVCKAGAGSGWVHSARHGAPAHADCIDAELEQRRSVA